MSQIESNKNGAVGALGVAVGFYLLSESVFHTFQGAEGYGWIYVSTACSSSSSISPLPSNGLSPLSQASCAGTVFFSLFMLLGGLISLGMGALSLKTGTHTGIGALSAAFAFFILATVTENLDFMTQAKFCEIKTDFMSNAPSTYNSKACTTTILTTIALLAGAIFGLGGAAVALIPSQKLPKALLAGAGLVAAVVFFMLEEAIVLFMTAKDLPASSQKTGIIFAGVFLVLAFVSAPVLVMFALLQSRRTTNEAYGHNPALDVQYKGGPEEEPLLV